MLLSWRKILYLLFKVQKLNKIFFKGNDFFIKLDIVNILLNIQVVSIEAIMLLLF